MEDTDVSPAYVNANPLTQSQLQEIANHLAEKAADQAAALALARIRASDPHPLTDGEIEAIAEKAAARALQLVYAEVGQSVVRKFLWLIGMAALGAAMFLAGRGYFPIKVD